MFFPIVAFGDPVLRKVAREIDSNYPNLDILIESMYQTMYDAHGVGLAAPQIGLDIRLFIIDSNPMFEQDDDNEGNNHNASDQSPKGVKKVFINAKMLESSGEKWAYTEGCLSIPGIRENVKREANIVLQYYDEQFNQHQERFTGLNARVIQHEYDHIEGKLFIDHLSVLKKRLIQRKLERISQGNVNVDYPMKFPASKGRR